MKIFNKTIIQSSDAQPGVWIIKQTYFNYQKIIKLLIYRIDDLSSKLKEILINFFYAFKPEILFGTLVDIKILVK